MTKAEEIVDLLRAQNWKNGGVHSIDRDDAVALVEQFGKAKAAEEAVRCTSEAWDKAIATLSTPQNNACCKGLAPKSECACWQNGDGQPDPGGKSYGLATPSTNPERKSP